MAVKVQRVHLRAGCSGAAYEAVRKLTHQELMTKGTDGKPNDKGMKLLLSTLRDNIGPEKPVKVNELFFVAFYSPSVWRVQTVHSAPRAGLQEAGGSLHTRPPAGDDAAGLSRPHEPGAAQHPGFGGIRLREDLPRPAHPVPCVFGKASAQERLLGLWPSSRPGSSFAGAAPTKGTKGEREGQGLRPRHL